MNKDVRKFVSRIASIEGVEVLQGGKHLRVLKDGRLVTTLPQTPSDHRWMANAVSELRQNGITPRVPSSKQTQPKIERLKPPDVLREDVVRLEKLKSRMALVRFLMEYADVRRLPNFSSPESGAQVLLQIGRGRGMAEWVQALLHQGLPAYEKWYVAREGQPLAAPPEHQEPEPAPEMARNGSAPILLRVNLDSLKQRLSEWGVELEVTGG